jgi:Transposase DDE domain
MRVYFRLPYRQTEGVVRAHLNNKIPSSVPDYSIVNRRLNKLEIKLNNRIENYIVMGYLKIHVAVDIKNKRIVSLDKRKVDLLYIQVI